MRVERAGDVVRQVGTADDWNGVVWSAPDLDPVQADAAIAAQVAHYTALGHDAFAWKLYAHDRPADLAERLLAAGFEAEEPETLLVAPVDGLSTTVDLPEGIRLRTMRDADDVLHPGSGLAGLWGGGKVPAWRGKGIYRALAAHRARIAAERGYRYLQVDASDQSRPVLQRLGFLALSTTTPYEYRPSR
ncbi:GNAT family N-acetyltransferase [Streptomyces sp. NPDC058439]|uniref:GNAT family N-acetyltransferase n=1 Tax=Streptomyces sp. NPDC058439 TaxID=3346500 RepID=UPI00364CB2E7